MVSKQPLPPPPSSPSPSKLLFLSCLLLVSNSTGSAVPDYRRGPAAAAAQLRFGRRSGEFKILQVADMHYADGAATGCLDVLPAQRLGFSDLNTTAFVRRMIRAERPDLIVFTGDNIFDADATEAARSLDAAFAPAVEAGIPWAAVLGNHDQEGTLPMAGVMRHVAGMPGALARFNPSGLSYDIDGFGNYHLTVAGVNGSELAGNSVVNLYFLDSGDYSTVPAIKG